MLASVFSAIEFGVVHDNFTPAASKCATNAKTSSNPKVDEGEQHPIPDDRYEGSSPDDFFSLGIYLYSYSRIWERMCTRKLSNSTHSSSVSPS